VKLTELEPHWVAEYNAPADAKQGVSFLCPHCRGLRLAVFFDVPICGRAPVDIKAVHRQQSDDGHLNDHHIGRTLWHREGESFETLTLQPSVDASHFGHWHGFITNGEIS
jgi:hypothetical protein